MTGLSMRVGGGDGWVYSYIDFGNGVQGVNTEERDDHERAVGAGVLYERG